jgi:TonB family protein
MQTLRFRGGAYKARFAGVLAGSMLLALAQTASAQTTPPAGNPIDQAPSEAARRAALSPYRFILQHSTAPRKPAAAPAPAPAAAAEPKKASAPVQQAAAQPSATQTVRALEPAAPAPQPAAAPAPALPEPAVAAVSRQPTEPAPRLEIIPVRTDEPRLPPALIREQPKGTVRIAFDIQHDGSTKDVKVLASTNRALNRPTVEAVQNWKFQPVDAVLTVETEVVYKFD